MKAVFVLRCLSHGKEVFYDNTRMLWLHKDGAPCREMNEIGILRDKTYDEFDPNISLSDIIRGRITTNFVCGAFRYLRDAWINKSNELEFQKKIAKVLMCLILGQYVGERIDPSELESMEKYTISIENMLLSLAIKVAKDTIKQINTGLAEPLGKIIVTDENSLRIAIYKIISEEADAVKTHIRLSIDQLQSVIHSQEIRHEDIIKDVLEELGQSKKQPEEEQSEKSSKKIQPPSVLSQRLMLIYELRKALTKRRLRRIEFVRLEGFKAVMESIKNLSEYAINNTDVIVEKKVRNNDVYVRINSKINFGFKQDLFRPPIIRAKFSKINRHIDARGALAVKIRDMVMGLLYSMSEVRKMLADIPRVNIRCGGNVEVSLDIDDDEILELLKLSLFSTYINSHIESIYNAMKSFIRERLVQELSRLNIEQVELFPLFSDILDAYRSIDDDLFRLQLLVIAYIFLTGHYNLSEEDSNSLLGYIIYTDRILYEISEALATAILNVLLQLLLKDLLAGDIEIKPQRKIDPRILMFTELVFTFILYDAIHNVLVDSASKIKHLSTVQTLMDISSDLLLDLRRRIDDIFKKYHMEKMRNIIEDELNEYIGGISSRMLTIKSHLSRIYIVVSLQRIFRERYPDKQIEVLPIEKLQERNFNVHITIRAVTERPRIRFRSTTRTPKIPKTIARVKKLSLREKRRELNIPVVLEDMTLGIAPAYTDGQVIYVNPLFIDSLLREGYTEKQIVGIIGGLIVHEKAHILYSDFIILTYLRILINLIGESEYVLLRHIFNIIEDARIEFLVCIYRPLEAEKLFVLSLLNRDMAKPDIEDDEVRAITLAIDILMLLLWGHIREPEEVIDKIKNEKIRRFLAELFGIDTVVMLFRGARGSRSRDALASATLFWAKIISLLEKYFGEYKNAIEKYVDNLKPGLLALLQKDVEKIVSRLFPFLPDEIKNELIDLLKKSKTLHSFLSMIREVANKFLRGIEQYDHQFGAYDRARRVIVSRHDYMFYNSTTKRYAKTIQELKRKIEKLRIQYREKPSRFGDIMEEHLPRVYIWSLTRDQPAPQTFTGYDRVIPKLDILIHIDLSGSMAKVATFVLRAAIIILEAFKYLIEKDIIRLAIVSFGDTYAINKSLCEPPRKVRIEKKLYGGTVIFETLLGAINSMKDEWRKDSTKIIFIFTDTEDSLEDLEMAETILNNIRTTLGDIKFIVLSTNKSPLKTLRKHVDRTIFLRTLKKLPKVLTNQILRAITKRSLTRIY